MGDQAQIIDQIENGAIFGSSGLQPVEGWTLTPFGIERFDVFVGQAQRFWPFWGSTPANGMRLSPNPAQYSNT